MNVKQIIILIVGLSVSGLIVWQALPIEFPQIIYKTIMLFVKLTVVLALTIFAYVFARGKKKQ